MSKIIGDEQFEIDFLYIKIKESTIKNIEVIFPARNQYIIFGETKEFFNTAYIEDEGMSKDNLYHKVATPDFVFWISPNDYDRFMEVLNYRHSVLVENKKAKLDSICLNNERAFEYDVIDDDIYNCFVAYKSGMTSEIGTWEKFYKVEAKIAEKCLQNGGKYSKMSLNEQSLPSSLAIRIGCIHM